MNILIKFFPINSNRRNIVKFFYKILTFNFHHTNTLYTNTLSMYNEILKNSNFIFDVGANIGIKTEMYLKYGCKVVAIEPQGSCIRILEKKFRNNENVIIIQNALGEQEGESKLFVCNEAPTLSTMTNKWRNGRFSNYKFKEDIIVNVITIDKLIERFGTPDFIKIDVEGFEESVIKGLTNKNVNFISYEFTAEFFEDAEKILYYLKNNLDYTKFNFATDEEDLYFKEWVSIDKIISEIKTKIQLDKFLWGDIYAQR